MSAQRSRPGPAARFAAASAMLLLLLAMPLRAEELLGIRIGEREGTLRVVLDLDRHPRWQTEQLTEPDRFVIDLAGTRLRGAVPKAPFPPALLKAIRTGAQRDGTLRVVLDLSGPPGEVRTFALDRNGGRPPRLVIDLVPGAANTVGADVPGTEQGGRGDEPLGADPAPARPAINADDYLRDPPLPAGPPGEALIGERRGGTPAPEAPEAPTRRAPPPEARRGPEVDFSGTWEHEWAWATDSEDSQKFETLLEPRMDLTFPSGTTLTSILRFRGDTVGDLGPFSQQVNSYSGATAPWLNDEHGSVELRELYLDLRTGPVDWRLGKQQVVWGQADGIKVLDVVNPQSFREFILDDFDDSRIPLWTVNANIGLGDAGELQLLWIPDTSYHELAEFGATFELSSPRLIPVLPISVVLPVDKPDDPFGDSDVGLQWSAFLGGWDLTLNYLYQHLDIPALPVLEVAPGVLAVAPEYRRSHLAGGTFSTAFGPFTLRGELAWNSDSLQPIADLGRGAVFETSELSSVIGIDWVAGSDLLLSAQWFQSTLEDGDPFLARSRTDNTVSFLYQQDFANASWRIRGLALHNLDDEDSLLQLKLKYWLTGTVQVWLGTDVFLGSERGLFGQFDRNDRVLLGFEYGF